ncbi:hypothetical protein KC669_04995 [Candidatus Dojkabacteria bacterium]|uniref:Heat-inducible transcription repressor HrcA n=1 Tax=Candidatus Dojkabacteria bacterium TaxID=2099670 RepID=A0A955LC03_9BACT|nr:hypothetical protein [Candidatus Dojkabacteria bacterium]
MSITDRQQQLLQAIIEEFIETAEAVGSISLLDKYQFKLSSATIRNEMAELVFRGYLYKKHSSAGRIPTTKGWRFFVDKINSDKINYIDANTQDEVVNNLVKLKDDKTHLIRQGLEFLSGMADNAVVALLENSIYYAGLSTITQLPEMREEDNLKRILRILEDYYTLSDVFHKGKSSENINILIGEEETGKEIFKNYSVIFSEVQFNNSKGFIAVVGPNRMDYGKVISSLKYISDTIKYIINN